MPYVPNPHFQIDRGVKVFIKVSKQVRMEAF